MSRCVLTWKNVNILYYASVYILDNSYIKKCFLKFFIPLTHLLYFSQRNWF